MAYPQRFIRLALSGTLYGVEQFSLGLAITPEVPNALLGDDMFEVPAGIIAACTDFWGQSFVGSDALLTTIKYNTIGTDGLYVDKSNSKRHDYATPLAGGGGADKYPPQVALAVSLVTSVARGLAHAGRIYIPLPWYSVEADGRLSDAHAILANGFVTTFLNAINTAAGVDGRVSVMSKVGAGAVHPVDHVRTGRTLDTVRSRRKSLPELYHVGASLAS
jgi:hypothetical protein